MPPSESSRGRPGTNHHRTTTTTTPAISYIPFRPFVFIARRTLIFCGVLLISYVLVTNMIGYERIWSSYSPQQAFQPAAAAATMAPTTSANERAFTSSTNRRRQQVANRRANEGNVVVNSNKTDERVSSPPRTIEDEFVGDSDLIVDQTEPRFENEDNRTDDVDINNNNNVPISKTGAASSSMIDSKASNARRKDVDGAQQQRLVVENLLTNRTYAPPIDEDKRMNRIDSQKRRSHGADLPLCPEMPTGLIGKMKQSVLLMNMLKESDVIRTHPEISRGGHWKPESCKARYKIAVIVPFRDRQSHLNRLIDFIIPMMERQLLDFRFIVTEQYGKDLFNKGRIMNAAFLLAEKLGVDCVIFHDVDMFPQDDRNFYYCPTEPKHLGAYVNTLGYELWYDYIVGGVLAINVEHYRQINGYSNMYWAWGGEDDDMGYRILANNFTIERPNKNYGTYTMLKHVKRQRTAPSMIYKLLNTAKTRWVSDGLNQVEWKVVKLIVKPLYYHLYVDVGTPPDEWRYEKPTKK